MSRHSLKKRWALLCTAVLLGMGLTTGAMAGDIQLAAKGKAKGVVVVQAGTMAEDVKFPRNHKDYLERIVEIKRQLLRDSARDLALYLGKMSGAEFEVVEALPKGDRRTPIYVGTPAQKVFGPVGISKDGAYGFRVVTDPKRGLGLYGESEYGTSYAIYELLHRLGCRWYMPTELGEVVPSQSTLTVPVMDEKRAPATESRSMSQGGKDWRRRNRFRSKMEMLGRLPGKVNMILYHGQDVSVAAGHNSFYRLLPKEKRDANPELRMMDDGKRSWQVRLTHPGVAEIMAETIFSEIETHFADVLKAGYRLTYSLTLPDMQADTEDPYERKNDPDPRVWEDAAGRWSVTDRYVLLGNRIAEIVTKKYPNVHLGLSGYVNYCKPPARYKPHPNLDWTICPIDFNRHTPMNTPDTPNKFWLRDMVEGWGKQPSGITPKKWTTAAKRFAVHYHTLVQIPLAKDNPVNCGFWFGCIRSQCT